MSDEQRRIRRGEVYLLAPHPGLTVRYVAVVSHDAHNAAADTVSVAVVPLLKRPGKAFSVPTSDPDPVAGNLHVREVMQLNTSRLVECVGMLAGVTQAAVDVALADFYDLNPH